MEIEEVYYNNRRYYRKPNHQDRRWKYFRASERARISNLDLFLHRQIWLDNFGPIPKGHHIHHKDHDPANNSIENLECLTFREHMDLHKEDRRSWSTSQENKENLDRGRKYSIEWMKSEKGIEHGRKMGIIQREKSKVSRNCYVCGNEFIAIDLIKKALYCSVPCKKVAARSKKKTMTCVVCGKVSEIYKYTKATSCYGRCTALKGHLTRKSKKL